jgi:TIR domain
MTSKVFISYRRDDSAGYAGRLHDQLAAEFGREQIVIDVDSFPLGINFVTALRREVGKCDVLLAVIGPNWLNVQDEAGRPRLDDLNDFVRTEIATALQRNIPVIPILLDGVKPPRPDQLPQDLQELSLRNALHVRHTSFSSDVGKLVRALKALEQTEQEHIERESKTQAGERAEENYLKREAEADQQRVESPSISARRSLRPPPLPDPKTDENEYEQLRPTRSYRGLITVATLLLIVFGAAGAGFYYRFQSALPAASPQTPSPQTLSPQPAPTPTPQKKFTGRPPQEQPAVDGAQRAVLYDADANDPQGKRFAGSVTWRTQTVSPGPGLAAEIVVRADVAIPERHMNVTWSLRRNTDKALPASHTIEVMFNLPPDFPGGGIANVPGILMKDSEEVRGMPLAGLAVKVTNGFFLIGLNSADDDMQRNLQLLKERAWFDVLIVNNDNSRSILTMEKGAPGDRAFAEAFKAWGE